MVASAPRDDATPPPTLQQPPAANEHAEFKRTLDVLTVGDGNFSFSLAFLRKHGTAIRLVATSFDAFDELVGKYPESARICAQLVELGAAVLHRVDAANLHVSLRNAVVRGESEVAAEKTSSSRPATAADAVHERYFDRVIFNHPHCGEENVLRHQSLLSHFYVAAQRVLRPGSGRIHVTLAEGQPKRWEARERAAKAGLVVVHEINDVDADDEYAVGYERKRHQNGKSFHRVLLHGERKQQASTLFVLAAACDAQPQTEHGIRRERSSDASMVTRKRKLRDAAPSTVEAPANETVPQPASSPFVCEPCAKSFKTAQGLKTHVHMVHELGIAGEATSIVKHGKPRMPCGQCERSFQTDEALRQHQISKHGEDGSIRPDWFRPLAVTTSALEPTAKETATHCKTCSICGLGFADESSFNDHWQELQPKTVTRRTCSLCHKSFEEERALRQHQNFCRVKAVERKESVGSSR